MTGHFAAGCICPGTCPEMIVIGHARQSRPAHFLIGKVCMRQSSTIAFGCPELTPGDRWVIVSRMDFIFPDPTIPEGFGCLNFLVT